MWNRSDRNKLRYSVMLSDGDGKVHSSVNGNPYPVSKEECINHVHKYPTYHLSRVSAAAKWDNVQTGGRRTGQLAHEVIKRLSKYYR